MPVKLKLFLIMTFVISWFIAGCTEPVSLKKDFQGFPQHLPVFSLKDPHGKQYESEKLNERDLIVVVTAPTLHNQSAQTGWSQYLNPARDKKSVTLVFLEDMAPSLFKGKARESMRRESKSGEEPILLIDPQGEVRKMFKVPANQTQVLVYKKKGQLVYVETNKPSSEGAIKIWRSLGILKADE